MIKQILHSWSFYMKFIKFAEGLFDKFHMKMTTHVRSSIYSPFTGKVELKSSLTHLNKFESGSLDEFLVEVANIGELKKIK